MRALVRHNDPSPSRFRYRVERLWLKPSVRRTFRLWLPLGVTSMLIWVISSDPVVRHTAQMKWVEIFEIAAARPEFQVETVEFPDVSDDLQQQILTVTGLTLPVSSIVLEVAELKRLVETLDAVETAQVRVLGGGVLQITTVERTPVLVWRDAETLRLIDAEGNRVADIARRSARRDLPLIVGLGGDKYVPEALALLDVLNPIVERFRGFVRVGERRWDVVLDRDQTILLPEYGAVTALRRVMALHMTEDLLNRDIVVVDIRNGARPVLRLTDEAIAELRRLRAEVRGEHE
ncbi:MAG: cell division protein FtsQ/DivIB [Paracoccaceae bacterium]